MNMFPCHQEDVWQCEWHDDCMSNFTLQTSGFAIIIRDAQHPNAPNAIEFADPNATFVAVVPTSINSGSESDASPLSAGAEFVIVLGAGLGLSFLEIVLESLLMRRRGSKLSDGPMATDNLCAQCGHGKFELTDWPARMDMDAVVIKPEIDGAESEVGNGPWGVGWLDRGS